MNNKKVLFAMLPICALPLSAHAAAPTLGEVLSASGISASGYIDTSYTYLSSSGTFVGPAPGVAGVPSRVYDREPDSFNLNMLDLTLSSLPTSGFGALVDLTAGSDADVNAPVGTGNNDQFDILQAYLNYGQGPFTVLAGKFTTLAGFETSKSVDNLNFSRSYLFGYAQPVTHLGLRGSFVANDTLKFSVGINNGWDVAKESQSERNKTLEFGVNWSPMKDLALSGAFYRGEEPGVVPGHGGARTLLDLVASYNVTSTLLVGANLDIATQDDALVGAGGGDADWRGLAAYAGYRLNELWRVAGRVEYFDDADGFRTGVKQKLREATATVAYMPAKAVELRGEIRGDLSNESSFQQDDGSTKKSQQSIAFEALYKF